MFKITFIAGVFSVKLISSNASERCGLREQFYTLVITPVALQLRESDENDTLLLTWPYQFIRKYGYDTCRFMFEAGRKCDSGEGEFHLEHSNQQEIFRCMASKMKNMKKLLNESGVTSIMCGENQFQAAMSMMAGSRSPLPPSSTCTLPLILDSDINSFLCSTKPLMPLPSLSNAPTQPPLPPPLKPKPKAILSKKLPTPLTNEPFYETNEMESSDAAYEDVQDRNDAWRTMGLDDSDHCPYASNTVISNDGAENYDHLQHIGFITTKTAPGYKQINSIAPTTKHKSFVKADTVIMPARKADDSHYGYGTINKKNSTDENRSNNESLKPIAHNELQYALVFKPNKV